MKFELVERKRREWLLDQIYVGDVVRSVTTGKWFVVIGKDKEIECLVSLSDDHFGLRLFTYDEAIKTYYHKLEPGEQLIITGE